VVMTVAIDKRNPPGNRQAAPGAGPSALPIIERKDPLTLLTSEIVIEAPSEVVWQVLVDFDSYSDWNPVEIEARGEAVVGAAFGASRRLSRTQTWVSTCSRRVRRVVPGIPSRCIP
jgi:hypothetical protein